jgi:hypothetical protein
MNRVIVASAAVVALLVSLTGCERGSDPEPPAPASIARTLRAHGIDCTRFEPSRFVFDAKPNVGACELEGMTLDIATFRSPQRRRIYEVLHDGICLIASLRDDAVTLLPYVRGERWIVSVPHEIVTAGEGDAWRSLAPRVAQALGGAVANVDCPALNA